MKATERSHRQLWPHAYPRLIKHCDMANRSQQMQSRSTCGTLAKLRGAGCVRDMRDGSHVGDPCMAGRSGHQYIAAAAWRCVVVAWSPPYYAWLWLFGLDCRLRIVRPGRAAWACVGLMLMRRPGQRGPDLVPLERIRVIVVQFCHRSAVLAVTPAAIERRRVPPDSAASSTSLTRYVGRTQKPRATTRRPVQRGPFVYVAHTLIPNRVRGTRREGVRRKVSMRKEWTIGACLVDESAAKSAPFGTEMRKAPWWRRVLLGLTHCHR